MPTYYQGVNTIVSYNCSQCESHFDGDEVKVIPIIRLHYKRHGVILNNNQVKKLFNYINSTSTTEDTSLNAKGKGLIRNK